MYFIVYVDDVILIGSNMDALTHLLSILRHDFPFKNLGSLHSFLGIQCTCTPIGMILSQENYIWDLLHKTNMTNCKLVTSPMASNSKLFAFDSNSMEDPTLYRSTVGSLQYLLITRLDLAFSVNRVCQFMHYPHISHWQAVKWILCYLQHTVHYGLQLHHSSPSTLAAFSDADWAGCPVDRKSTGGYYIFFGKNLVS